MNLGILIPTMGNWPGLVDMLNSIQTKHRHELCILDNLRIRRSVAQAWNDGCDMLFDNGMDAVVVANDDILLHPDTIDSLVDASHHTGAWIVTADNVRDRLLVEAGVGSLIPNHNAHLAYLPILAQRFLADTTCVADGIYTTYKPDMSFFLLRKKTWEKIGRFDENFKPAYFEDNDYHARIELAGGYIMRYTGSLVFHYGGMTQYHPQNPQDGVVVGTDAYKKNAEFFLAKWGHEPVHTKEEMLVHYYKTPFNDPILSLRDCPRIR